MTRAPGRPSPPPGPEAASDPEEHLLEPVEVLRAERDRLLAMIAELDFEHQAGVLADLDWESLRDSATRRAAAAIRATEAREAGRVDAEAEAVVGVEGSLDRLVAPAPAEHRSDGPGRREADRTAPAVPAARRAGVRRRRRRRNGIIAIGSLAVLGSAFVLLSVLSSTRLPGQTISGSVELSPGQQLIQRLDQARELVAEHKPLEAIQLYQQILATSPDQPEALADEGWLIRVAGVSSHDSALVARGRVLEESAVAADPSYANARAYLGIMELEDVGDPAAAVSEFRAFLADHPSSGLLASVRGVARQAFSADHQPVPAALEKS
jgi:tetratricopeptide (TPR) repeat protein